MSHLPAARSVTAILAMFALVLLAVPAGAAEAAPPDNDTVAGARPLGIRPHSVEQDTSAASFEEELGCTPGASVWYRMRVERTRTVRISTLGTDYDTVLGVYAGPADSLQQVACNDDSILTTSAVRLTLKPGTTYFVAASACCSPKSRGGHLVLNVVSQKKLTTTTNVTSTTAGRVSGRSFLSGVQRCNHPSAFQVTATLSQRVGQWVARGTSEMVFPFCHGATDYSIRIDSETAVAFRPGRPAMLTLDTAATDSFQSAVTRQISRVVEVTAGQGAAQLSTGARVPRGVVGLAPRKG